MLSIYLGISGFLGLFTIIYYQFAHGVTSVYMTFLFAIPMAAGFLNLLLKKLRGEPGEISKNTYPAGVAALIMASMLQGIFEIAGNSSRMVLPLFVLGSLLTVVGILTRFLPQKRIA